MRDNKEYLHFYLGQKVRVETISKEFGGFSAVRIGTVVNLETAVLSCVLEDLITVKLILRSLDSMTEEEDTEFTSNNRGHFIECANRGTPSKELRTTMEHGKSSSLTLRMCA